MAIIALGRDADWLYYLIKIYASLWSISLFSLLWSFVDRYFVILSAG